MHLQTLLSMNTTMFAKNTNTEGFGIKSMGISIITSILHCLRQATNVIWFETIYLFFEDLRIPFLKDGIVHDHVLVNVTLSFSVPTEGQGIIGTRGKTHAQKMCLNLLYTQRAKTPQLYSLLPWKVVMFEIINHMFGVILTYRIRLLSSNH